MSYHKKSLLFAFGETLLTDPILLVDVGARGQLSQPFHDIREKFGSRLKVVAFEPDCAASSKVEENLMGELVFNRAAWNKNEELTLYVTKNPSASSLFKPSDSARRTFASKHFVDRLTVAEQKVRGISIDDAVDGLSFARSAFFKCDTQGAEYQVAVGAEKFLRNSCVGMTMECWTQPIYEGSRTVDEVIGLVRSFGFEIFDLQVSAAWTRSSNGMSLIRKSQIVGLDFLAFKQLDKFYGLTPSTIEIVQFALLADLWGFPDYSLQILNHEKCLIEPTLKNFLLSQIVLLRKSRIYERIPLQFHRNLLKRFFGIATDFPFIH